MLNYFTVHITLTCVVCYRPPAAFYQHNPLLGRRPGSVCGPRASVPPLNIAQSVFEIFKSGPTCNSLTETKSASFVSFTHSMSQFSPGHSHLLVTLNVIFGGPSMSCEACVCSLTVARPHSCPSSCRGILFIQFGFVVIM